MVILENIDIDIDIDKAILQNIDIDKISNRFKFGISNRATNIVQTMHINDVFMTIFVPHWNQEIQVHPMQKAFQSKY